MSEPEFWQVIARTKRGRNGTQAERLERHLETLSKEDLLEFELHYLCSFGQAYTYPLWGAMYIIFGGCSDDGFMDARAGLIALGEERFKAALENPDSLAKIKDPEDALLEGCDIQYVAQKVFERRFGLDGFTIPVDSLLPDKPSGERVDWEDEDEMLKAYPKLWKRFGDDL